MRQFGNFRKHVLKLLGAHELFVFKVWIARKNNFLISRVESQTPPPDLDELCCLDAFPDFPFNMPSFKKKKKKP